MRHLAKQQVSCTLLTYILACWKLAEVLADVNSFIKVTYLFMGVDIFLGNNSIYMLLNFW